MSKSHQHHKTAFTLVELLVVMAIIGILIGLLIPTIRGVMIRAEVSRLVMEIKQLESGIEAYKKKFDDYPPDFTDPALVVRHARKVFPRIADADINALLKVAYQVDNISNISSVAHWQIDPAEALVFWLSGFSDEVTRPFTGPGGPLSGQRRKPGIYDFDGRRLFAADDGDPFPVYLPRGFETPYVFFDARSYGYKLANGNVDLTAQYPPPLSKKPSKYHTEISGRARPYMSSLANEIWVNDRTFQILATGVDSDFGQDHRAFVKNPKAQWKRYPSAHNFTDGDNKNITNFSGGQLGDKTQ
jgi:prepilin-type N-terminal cleavage/methylation domain-containing protein